MRTTPFVAAAAILALSTSARIALAEDDASAVAAARTIGTEGLKLAESGNCRDAIEKLDRAEKLHHAPTTLAKLGECQVQVGRLVLGLEMLRRVVREPVAEGAPAAFHAAKTRAQKVIEETQGRVAQLRVNVGLPAGVTPQLSVDGEPVPAALLDVDRPTDPGSHTVEATAQGYKKATQTVSLKEGERISISLSPEVDPNAPPPSAGGGHNAVSSSDALQAKENGGALRVVGWTLLGVGVAGLATGAIAGGLALGTKGDLDGACNAQKECGQDEQDRIDRLKTESLVGTIGFIVGGVGVVGGGALLLFGPSQPSTKAESTKSPRLSLGLGSVSLRGAF